MNRGETQLAKHEGNQNVPGTPNLITQEEEETIVDAYIQDGMTMKDIAKKFKISSYKVSYILRGNNRYQRFIEGKFRAVYKKDEQTVLALYHKRAEKEAMVKDISAKYGSGVPVSVLTEKYGISSSYVYQLSQRGKTKPDFHAYTEEQIQSIRKDVLNGVLPTELEKKYKFWFLDRRDKILLQAKVDKESLESIFQEIGQRFLQGEPVEGIADRFQISRKRVLGILSYDESCAESKVYKDFLKSEAQKEFYIVAKSEEKQARNKEIVDAFFAGKSVVELAVQYHVTCGCIRFALAEDERYRSMMAQKHQNVREKEENHRREIQERTQKREARNKAILRDYIEGGQTAKEVGAKYGLSDKYIRNILRRYKISRAGHKGGATT